MLNICYMNKCKNIFCTTVESEWTDHLLQTANMTLQTGFTEAQAWNQFPKQVVSKLHLAHCSVFFLCDGLRLLYLKAVRT